MSGDDNEVEGVRILGAQEAGELSRTGSTSKSSSHKSATSPTEQSSNVDLPHWSEAPTGEVPVVESASDGWDALTASQPRLRVDQSEWKEGDYDPDLSLKDDSLSVGALGSDEDVLNVNDDDFERTVAEKRAASPSEPEGDRVAKISTVPSGITTEPVVGESITSAPRSSKAKAAISSRTRRDKKGGAAHQSAQNEPSTNSEMSALITRTLTGAVLAAIAVVCAFLGTIPLLILSALVIGAMSLELSGALRQMGSKPAVLLIGVMSFFSVIAGYLVGDRAIALAAVSFFFFSALWYLFDVVRARPVIGLGVSTLVYGYVGVFGAFAGMILGLSDSAGKSVGVFILVSTVLCVVANDVGAYLFGKFFGRTPLAPAISPNKTMEGTTVGIVASIVVGVFISLSSSDVWGGLKGCVALGVLVACASVFGDLIESMLKRDCKMKDFGTLLPGHGGLMDRFDGLLIALPVAYYLALALL